MEGDPTVEMKNLLSFVKELERLKNVTRTAWTSEGKKESVAEHSWRLAVLALVLEGFLAGVDISRVIRLCLVHDMGEAFEGDVSAAVETDRKGKREREKAAIERLLKPLSANARSEVDSLWREYDRGVTPEARTARALDKIETIAQHNQGKNPEDFDYAFNLGYGSGLARFHEILVSLRKIVDEETRDRMKREKQW